MRRALVVLIALLVAGSIVATGAMAQQTTPSTGSSSSSGASPSGASPATKEQSIEGKVKSWDASSHMLTLQDGTEISVPASVQVKTDQLKPGADVKASYEEKGGQKVATSVEVK